MASSSKVSVEARQRPLPQVAVERAHPLALAAWKVLRDRSEADRRLVFDACHRRLESPDTTESQALALHALESFKEQRGRAPTRRQYDDFRDAQPDKGDWPSATFIRKAFGSWPGALAALGEPEADALVLRLSSKGRAFSREEVAAAVRRWASQTDPPLQLKHFQAWCEDHRMNTGERLPLSPQTLYRLFGSWPATLDAAGLTSSARTPLQGDEPAAGFDLGGVPATTRRTFARDDLLEWLTYIGCQVGTQRAGSLTREGFDALVQSAERLVAAEGRVVCVPRSCTHVREFGSWPEAKLAAGWLAAEDAVHEPSRERYTDEELLEALQEAIAAVGPRLNRHDYRSWRQKRLAELSRHNPRARIPGEVVLRQRLGGDPRTWSAAVAQAITELRTTA